MPNLVQYNLQGRRALVTGAASGIGLGTATALAEAGARVAINHLPGDPRAKQAIDALLARGLDVIGAPGKVGVPQETEQMVEAAIDALGSLDLLVNNAGTPATRTSVPVERLDLVTDEMWDQILSTNLVGMFRCSRAAAPALKRARGSIVNTASIAALGLAGSSIPYSASKAAVIWKRGDEGEVIPEICPTATNHRNMRFGWGTWTPSQHSKPLLFSSLRRPTCKLDRAV